MPKHETPSEDELMPDLMSGPIFDLYPSLRNRLRVILASDDEGIKAKVEVLARMLERRGRQRAKAFADQYGLTPSEMRLADHIAQGGSVAAYAEAHGVSQGTVRTHLKSIFAKTGAHRQAQLVRLLVDDTR